MDAIIIHKTSEKTKHKIGWIKSTETEWIYCGIGNEIKLDVLEAELGSFFSGDTFYISTNRQKSFVSTKQDLLNSVLSLIGGSNFFVWTNDFLKVAEFNNIGVFRKGEFNSKLKHSEFKLNLRKISAGSPDRVNNKLIKYRMGDCLSINCKNGTYLGALISRKFNKYYDLTLIEYHDNHKPTLDNFLAGNFFGTRFGSWEDLTYAVNARMLTCQHVDSDLNFEKVGTVQLTSIFQTDGYGYMDTTEDLINYYFEELPIRVDKSKNAERFPDLAFVSKHLISMEHILQKDEQ